MASKTGESEAKVAPARRRRSTAKKPATTKAEATGAAPKQAAKPATQAPPKAPAATADSPAPTPPAAAQAAPVAQDLTTTPPAPDEGAPDTLRAEMTRKMIDNVERIEALSQRLVAALAARGLPNPAVDAPGPDFYLSAAGAWMKMLADQPARVIEQQVNYWGQTLAHYAQAQTALARGQLAVPEDEAAPKDRRFQNPLWSTHPYFNFIKRQYQINADAMRSATSQLEMPDAVGTRRVNWLTNQIIDMMAPTNFLATNPDALEKAIETEGESLVRGLENLVRDIEINGGEFLVSLADRDAFSVGENIGTTEGRVVHRTPMFELIQYKPLTETVHSTPILVFPPWINKYYIMDLKPQNSLLRWIVEQGHTLFVVSWKNPDASYADTGMGDYVAAYIEAMDAVQQITGQKKLNTVGYCIGGTTLSLTLGLLHKRGDDRVNSATLFTTLTDFSDLGEFQTFLQDDFIGGIYEEVARKGLFGAHLMSRTMSFLRPNDLVWGPAIRNYMLGETPPAFDLLYWNGDSTNLPGRMTIEYLEGLCRENGLVNDGFEVQGEKITLDDVTVPLCAVACETDHIAPWKDSWRGVAQMASRDKRFILSESGHIAGIINPPSKKKYGHYTGPKDFSGSYQDWKDAATFHEGSWWPHWGEWLADHSGPMVDAREPAEGLGPAPGDYVHESPVR